MQEYHRKHGNRFLRFRKWLSEKIYEPGWNTFHGDVVTGGDITAGGNAVFEGNLMFANRDRLKAFMKAEEKKQRAEGGTFTLRPPSDLKFSYPEEDK